MQINTMSKYFRLLILFSLVSIFFYSTTKAQWPKDSVIDQSVQKGIDHIYNFEFEKADSIFDVVIKLRPEHPVGYFFRAMVIWERIITNFENDSLDKTFYEAIESVISICDKLLDENHNDLAAIFFKGGAIGFRGRLRANRGEWLAAANDGVVALPLVQKAYKIAPNNYDVLLGTGIYNYYAEVIPEKYPFVKPFMLFLPNGDKKKGLEQLTLASRYSKYAKVEATYFLVQNYINFEKDYMKALELAKKLHAKYPNNSLFYRYLGRCLIYIGDMTEANKIFIDIRNKYIKKQRGYDTYEGREAYYNIARYEFLEGRYESALENFYKCDELSRKIDKDGASGFMSMANLNIGMIFDAQGKREYAIKQYKKVLDMKEYENSHADAKKYLNKPFKPF